MGGGGHPHTLCLAAVSRRQAAVATLEIAYVARRGGGGSFLISGLFASGLSPFAPTFNPFAVGELLATSSPASVMSECAFS
jgi:hypothetical protein